MSKTITVNLPDHIYSIFKRAAKGEKRSIQRFIENATLSYLTNEQYVSDQEMSGILKDDNLCKGLKRGIEDIKKGNYRFVS
jgi:hypothetical protein